VSKLVTCICFSSHENGIVPVVLMHVSVCVLDKFFDQTFVIDAFERGTDYSYIFIGQAHIMTKYFDTIL